MYVLWLCFSYVNLLSVLEARYTNTIPTAWVHRFSKLYVLGVCKGYLWYREGVVRGVGSYRCRVLSFVCICPHSGDGAQQRQLIVYNKGWSFFEKEGTIPFRVPRGVQGHHGGLLHMSKPSDPKPSTRNPVTPTLNPEPKTQTLNPKPKP